MMTDEMRPHEGTSGPGAAPEPPVPLPPEQPAAPEPFQQPSVPQGPHEKQPLDVKFTVLGFFTPLFVSALAGALGTALSYVDDTGLVSAAASGFLTIVTIAGLVVAFIKGRTTGDNRLRSFGFGGLISLAVVTLLSLLAFGACFVILSSAGI